jgi:hypothetical protein
MEVLIPITMFMCIAAVAILRPITTKLGGLLDVMRRERLAPPGDESELARLRITMERVAGRIDLIEERLDFTERLLNGSRRTPTPGRDELLRARGAELLRARDTDVILP